MTYPKPWTRDPVFQRTYFCNVHREDDKVTQYIRRDFLLPVLEDYYEFAIAVARFINWPDTLAYICNIYRCMPDEICKVLDERQSQGLKVFGDAYIVSTCGRRMGKVAYMREMLLPAAHEGLGPASEAHRYLRATPTLKGAYGLVSGIFGIQSFMAGQILADLKNTPDHPLQKAEDWWEWATPGPGSQRGMSWLFNGDPSQRFTQNDFLHNLRYFRKLMDFPLLDSVCNQDLQNCLCEFDKYCRVKAGTGRSKRSYPGV